MTEDIEKLTDETLFSRFKRGDKEAFGVVLKRYQGPIYSFILKSVGNKELAEDVFQDVFFKVVDKKDMFHPTISFRAWLYTLTRNTCIDRARKKNRTPKSYSLFYDEEKPLEEHFEADVKKPDEVAQESELDAQLDDALSNLPKEQRETFYLKVKSEMTFDEIGEAMKCSANTAKSRMRYALEQLRPILLKRGVLK